MTDLIQRASDTEDVPALARRFPAGFTWGAATSAYQIEGAVAEDGRGPSIWDTFSHEPGRTVNGETGDVAADHYHRWRDDVALMADLGLSAYRFSVSWPRVLPAGTGTPNDRGLAFYDQLVDGLLERGIKPVPTLYHWDLPQALQDRGGWTNPAIGGWFADYAGILAERFGDRVTDWITLNEPQVFSLTGNADGRHAPGLRDWPTALRVWDAAVRAHAAAADRIRAASSGARIGVALNINAVAPASPSQEDQHAADTFAAVNHRWFSDPLFGRGYPELGLEAHAAAGHLDGLALKVPPAGDLDFLGLNYYNRDTIAAASGRLFGFTHVRPPDVERTTMGWEVHPDGLREVLVRLHRDYAPRDMIISENGAAYPDLPAPDGSVDDPARRRYLARHVSAMADAIEAGVPVSGYLAWSLLDNFEWAEGYRQRFGIVHVDFATQRRTPKASGEWYRSLISACRAAQS